MSTKSAGPRACPTKTRLVVTGPWSSTLKDFLVAILDDADQAEQAKATLADAGFADRDLRVYTS